MNHASIDETHDADRLSWVQSAIGHPDFPIQNLPFGVFEHRGWRSGGVAIGDMVVDLAAVSAGALLPIEGRIAAGDLLNPFLALSVSARRELRRALSGLLSDPSYESTMSSMLVPASECSFHLPARIGDYTDFHAGIHHASNAGRLLRPDSLLMPNYKHMPIAIRGESQRCGRAVRRFGDCGIKPGRRPPRSRFSSRRVGSTTNWSWACGSGRATIEVSQYRSPRPANTSPGSAC